MKRTVILVSAALALSGACSPRDSAHASSVAERAADVAPSALAFPASTWTDYTMSENGPVDSSGASHGPFAANHAATYQGLGMQTGYQQGGTWGTFESIHYLGSSYSSVSKAEAAFNDGAKQTSALAGSVSSPCMPQNRFAASCSEYTYPDPSGSQVTYVAAQVGLCLVEVKGQAPSSFNAFTAHDDTQAFGYQAIDMMHLDCPTGVAAPPAPKTGASKTCTSKTVTKKVHGKKKHVKVKNCKVLYNLFGTIDAPSCGGGYATENVSVVIRDENNKVIGATSTTSEDIALESGTLDCVVSFSAAVPQATFYQIQVGTHAGPPYTFAQMQQVNWYLKLFLQS